MVVLNGPQGSERFIDRTTFRIDAQHGNMIAVRIDVVSGSGEHQVPVRLRMMVVEFITSRSWVDG